MNQVERVREALRRLGAVERIYRDEAIKAEGAQQTELAKRLRGTEAGVKMAISEVRHAMTKSESSIGEWGP